MILTDRQIVEVLDQLLEIFPDEKSVFAFDSEDIDDDTVFLIRSYAPLHLNDKTLSVMVDGETTEVKVINQTGEGVSLYTSDPEQEECIEADSDATDTQELAGVQIRLEGSGSLGGTLGISLAYFEIEHLGRKCAGSDVFVSCNHVIADNDAAPADSKIELFRRYWRVFSHLHCFIPVNTSQPLDIALGKLHAPKPLTYGRVPGVGTITGASVPKRNITVQKNGAVTGLQSGPCKGISYFRVGSRRYKCWRVAGNPFACAGDSGAAVIHKLRLLGFVIGGDNLGDCYVPRNVYFQSWDSVDTSTRADDVTVRLRVQPDTDNPGGL